MSDIEGTCPRGGLWYTCTAQSPTFFGCCTSDPCNGSGCPLNDLRPAGMGTGAGPDFPVNDSSFWPNVKCGFGSWWTCAVQTPSFQGCCGSNPCNGIGCPSGALYAAAFSTLPAVIGPSPSQQPSTAGTTSTFISPTSQSSAARSSSSNLPFSQPSNSQSPLPSSAKVTPGSEISGTPLPLPIIEGPAPKSTNIAAIAGGVAGGVAFLIFAGIILYIWRRRRRQKSVNHENSILHPAASNPSDHSSKNRNSGVKNHKPAFLSQIARHVGYDRSPMTKSSIYSPPLTPESPPPLYGARAIDEVHELGASNATGTGDRHGLGLRAPHGLEILQEADAQGDTPNPYPVQREWSTRRLSELPDGPQRQTQWKAVGGGVANDTDQDEAAGRREAGSNYTSWQNYTN